MSKDIVRLAQERLISLGYDPGQPDGFVGWQTESALTDWNKNGRGPKTQIKAERKIAPVVGEDTQPRFDQRSERNIDGLQPSAQRACRAWLAKCRAEGINAVVICGLRTITEQRKLYAQGRDTPGKIVTNAPGGYSFHNYGLAWDFVVFPGVNERGGVGAPLWSGDHTARAGQIALDMLLDWAGVWRSFRETPHIQIAGLKIDNLRKKFPNGWKA